MSAQVESPRPPRECRFAQKLGRVNACQLTDVAQCIQASIRNQTAMENLAKLGRTPHQPLTDDDVLALFHRLFDPCLEAVLLTHATGVVRAANPAACEVFGATASVICDSTASEGRAALVDESDSRLRPLLAE
ncbi:MAG: hypothetical protein K2Y02_11015, partial [Burkholderiaceae bacterium]|nr:hypothetical protein [Burkholderiaceae bacterium]